MSRDSLCFLIAGMYIKKGNLDTAIVYNLACTTSASLLYKSVLIQRNEILKRIYQKKSISDSVSGSAFTNLPELYISLAYMQFRTDRYSIFGLSDVDTFFDYKQPNCGLSVFYSIIPKKTVGSFLPGIDISIGGNIPIAKQTGAGNQDLNMLFNSKFRLSNKVSRQVVANLFTVNYSANRNTYFTDALMYEIPFGWGQSLCSSKFYAKLTIPGEIELREWNYGINLMGTRLPVSGFQKSVSIDMSYSWRLDDQYSRYIEGYTDELKYDEHYKYYFDAQCSDSFNGGLIDLNEYWEQLPLREWIVVSGQSIDLSTTFSGIFKLGKFWRFDAAASIKGRMFAGKTKWHNVENGIISYYSRSDGKDVIVLIYDKKSGQLYSHENPYSVSYMGGAHKCCYQEKRRLDGILGLFSSVCYARKKLGEICLSGNFNWTVSSLHKYEIGIPLPRLSWGIYSTWKPALFHRSEKKIKGEI